MLNNDNFEEKMFFEQFKIVEKIFHQQNDDNIVKK